MYVSIYHLLKKIPWFSKDKAALKKFQNSNASKFQALGLSSGVFSLGPLLMIWQLHCNFFSVIRQVVLEHLLKTFFSSPDFYSKWSCLLKLCYQSSLWWFCKSTFSFFSFTSLNSEFTCRNCSICRNVLETKPYTINSRIISAMLLVDVKGFWFCHGNNGSWNDGYHIASRY